MDEKGDGDGFRNGCQFVEQEGYCFVEVGGVLFA